MNVTSRIGYCCPVPILRSSEPHLTISSVCNIEQIYPPGRKLQHAKFGVVYAVEDFAEIKPEWWSARSKQVPDVLLDSRIVFPFSFAVDVNRARNVRDI